MSCLITGRKPCGELRRDDGMSFTTCGIVNRASPVESLIVEARADQLNGQNARRYALLCDRTSVFRARGVIGELVAPLMSGGGSPIRAARAARRAASNLC